MSRVNNVLARLKKFLVMPLELIIERNLASRGVRVYTAQRYDVDLHIVNTCVHFAAESLASPTI